MTTAIAQPIQVLGTDACVGTIARKRRRQILLSHRSKGTEAPEAKKCRALPPPDVPSTTSGTAITPQNAGIAPPSSVEETTRPLDNSNAVSTKKPQMRYDPKVPMTKEGTTAWRREQRRKRNRESAAASRQRQRDRISELEEEVSEWKTKYEVAIARLAELEKLEKQKDLKNVHLFKKPDVLRSTDIVPNVKTAAVSPCPSPPLSPGSYHNVGHVSPTIFEEKSSCRTGFNMELEQQGEVKKHLIEISRPA